MTLLGPWNTTLGAIATPTWSELVRGSTTVCRGTVERVEYTSDYLGHVALLAVVGALTIFATIAFFRARSYTVAVLLLATLIVGGGVMMPGFVSGSAPRIATVRVAEQLHGNVDVGEVIQVRAAGSMCDATTFSVGAEYYLFLSDDSNPFTLAFVDWGLWEATEAGVQTLRRAQTDRERVPTQSFRDAIQSQQANWW